MTDMVEDPSPSDLELIVLARLSCSKTPKLEELAKAVSDYAPGELSRPAREVLADLLTALRQRGWVRERAKRLTDEGGRVLRLSLGLTRTPLWSEICEAYLPALGLGLRPGSDEARKALRDAGTIAVAVLRPRIGIDASSKLDAVADTLIARQLGLPPGPVNLKRIRAHLLTREMASALEREPVEPTTRVREAAADRPLASKRSMVRALARCGIRTIASATDAAAHEAAKSRDGREAPRAWATPVAC